MRDHLRGNTEQGLDFIHQRIYAIGLAQTLEILQDDVLAPLFRANTLLVSMKIQDGVLLPPFRETSACARFVGLSRARGGCRASARRELPGRLRQHPDRNSTDTASLTCLLRLSRARRARRCWRRELGRGVRRHPGSTIAVRARARVTHCCRPPRARATTSLATRASPSYAGDPVI